jgi:hypothetical protein
VEGAGAGPGEGAQETMSQGNSNTEVCTTCPACMSADISREGKEMVKGQMHACSCSVPPHCQL